MGDEISLEEGSGLIPSLLSQLVFEENVIRRLRAINTIIRAVDDEIKNKLKIDTFKIILNHKYLKNVEFMRQLKLYSKMNDNIETSLEYHGTDYITHQEFIFDEKFDIEIEKLSSMIDKLVGNLIKEYSKGESIDFG